MAGEHFSYSSQKIDQRVTFQNRVSFLPANVPQDGVDSMKFIRKRGGHLFSHFFTLFSPYGSIISIICHCLM